MAKEPVKNKIIEIPEKRRRVVQMAFEHYKDRDNRLEAVHWMLCSDGSVWYYSPQHVEWVQHTKLPPGCE